MFPDFLNEPVDMAAEKLLGGFLKRVIAGKKVLVGLMETEAYDQEEAASPDWQRVMKLCF